MKLRFLLVLVLTNCVRSEKYLPILIWHSAGQTCCGDEIQSYTTFLKANLEQNVYVKSVALDNDPKNDLLKSLTEHPFNQINFVCAEIQNDPKFRNGYNAVGLSQGGLFLRGLAQTCPFPPMKNLISLGGPQQGVHQYPRCKTLFGNICGIIKSTIDTFGYFWLFQKTVAPLTYWHDYVNEENYKRQSTFLAVINNENEYNANYVLNLNQVKRIILVKYEDDKAIIPNESSWFGYFNRDKGVLTMEETDVFLYDKLGLQALLENGRLIRLLSPGDHLNLNERWFRQEVIPFLKEL